MTTAINVVKTMADTFGGEGAWDTLLSLMKTAPDMLTEPYTTEIKVERIVKLDSPEQFSSTKRARECNSQLKFLVSRK